MEALLQQFESNLNNVIYYINKHSNNEHTGIYDHKDKFAKFEPNYQNEIFNSTKMDMHQINKIFQEYKYIYSITDQPKIRCGVDPILYKYLFENHSDLKQKNYIGFNSKLDDHGKNISKENYHSFEDKVKLLHNNFKILKLDSENIYCTAHNYSMQFVYNKNKNFISLVKLSNKICNIDYAVEKYDIIDSNILLELINYDSLEDYIKYKYHYIVDIENKLKDKFNSIEIVDISPTNIFSKNHVFKFTVSYDGLKFILEFKNGIAKIYGSKTTIFSFDNSNLDKQIVFNSTEHYNQLFELINNYLKYKRGHYGYFENNKYYRPKMLEKNINKYNVSRLFDIYFKHQNNINNNFSLNIIIKLELFHNVYLYDCPLDDNIDFYNDEINIDFYYDQNLDKENCYAKLKLFTKIITKKDIDNIINCNESFYNIKTRTCDASIKGSFTFVQNEILKIFNIINRDNNVQNIIDDRIMDEYDSNNSDSDNSDSDNSNSDIWWQ